MSPALIPAILGLAAVLIWPLSYVQKGKAAATALAALALLLALVLAASGFGIAAAGEAIRANADLPFGLVFALRLDALALAFLVPVLIAALAVAFCAQRLFERAGPLRLFQSLLLALVAAQATFLLADRIWLALNAWFLAAAFAFVLLWRSGDLPAGPGRALPFLAAMLAAGLAFAVGLQQLGEAAGRSELTVISHRLAGLPGITGAASAILAGVVIAAGLIPFRIAQTRALTAPAPVLAFLLPAGPGLAAIFLLARLTPVGAGATLTPAPFVAAALLLLALFAMLAGGASAMRRRGLPGIVAALVAAQVALALLLAAQPLPGARMALILVVAALVPATSALFLCAGVIQRETGSPRLPVAGGLIGRMPLTALLIGLALLSLAGLLPFAGYHAMIAVLDLAASNALSDRSAPVLLAALMLSYALIMAAVLHCASLARRTAPVPKGTTPVTIRDPGWQVWLAPALLVALLLLAGLLPAPIAALAEAAAQGTGEAGTARLALWQAPNDAAPWAWLASLGLGIVIHGLRRPVPRLDEVDPEAWSEA